MDQSISSRTDRVAPTALPYPFSPNPFAVPFSCLVCVVPSVSVQCSQCVRFLAQHNDSIAMCRLLCCCYAVRTHSKSTPRVSGLCEPSDGMVMMQLLLHHIYCQCLSKSPLSFSIRVFVFSSSCRVKECVSMRLHCR